MSLFSGQRLDQRQLQQDIEGLRRGLYTDRYFANVARILQGLAAEGYRFQGSHPRPLPVDLSQVDVGNIVVEAQVFNRRAPRVVVGGVDAALSMLRHATGYFEGDQFIETWQNLEVHAVEDGELTHYDGDPANIQPVIKIHGRYRDFALLETSILGVLSHISRISTNVYELLHAADGKPVLFFPARFDLPQTQASDGYGYWLAVQRYNLDAGKNVVPSVSTDAQGLWWGGRGGGTVPHALIASFLGDSAEAMIAFARHLPITTPRTLLADFDNDTITTTRQTLAAYWQHYRAALLADDETEQKRWTLNSVRLDTAGNLVDAGLPANAEPGVSADLVKAVRAAIDSACETWGETGELLDAARAYCKQVRIVVTGGFNKDKIALFERDNIPADVYGVGSTFLKNDSATNTDYTMDIVRVQLEGQWFDIAKVGRQPGTHPALQPVDLANL